MKHYNSHYEKMAVQPIELMQAILTPEEMRGYLKGNIIKYGKRAGLKEGESVEKDVNKFNHYKEMLDNFEHGRPILGETRKEIRTSDEDGEKRESVFREG